MDANTYEREYIARQSRPLTQMDLRVALLMSVLALVLVNALL